jgi:hypothetical protein
MAVGSKRASGESDLRCFFVRFNQARLVAPCAVAFWLLGAANASADDTQLLTRMLRESRSFRVRASAAQVMGRRREADKRPELEGALADQHPAVRAAAANALGQIGSPESLPPLNDSTRDTDKTVVGEAKQAIHTIEAHTPASQQAPAKSDVTKPRFGLMLGEMRNSSAYQKTELIPALNDALEHHLKVFADVAVFAAKQIQQAHEARDRGLSVYRLDAAVTSMSTTSLDGQLWVHCEVLLLLMDGPTGLLRTVLKGAARGVETPSVEGAQAQQRLSMSRRVLDAAVRSALRNADTALTDAFNRTRPATAH